MGSKSSNFIPYAKHISVLHGAADNFEEKAEPFLKRLKSFKEASLVVRDPHQRWEGMDILSDEWHRYYSQIVWDCEVQLVVRSRKKILTSKIDRIYCKARLTKLPGCCGVCVITKLEVHPDMRKQGVGNAFVKVLIAFAKVLNYSCLIMTVEKFNTAPNTIAGVNNFSKAEVFANAKTKNTVAVYTKNINPEGIALTDGYDKEDQ